MSCHPSHRSPEDLAQQQQEQIDLRQKEQQHDPRKIHRQHRWRLGHDPAGQDDDDDPNIVYLKMDGREAPPTEPDQRHMLSGGELSGIPCERCGTETRITGEMSVWNIYHQPGVEVANLADITDARKKELQEQIIVVLKCPQCRHTYQWDAAFLPKGV
jgi:hypothetical protein